MTREERIYARAENLVVALMLLALVCGCCLAPSVGHEVGRLEEQSSSSCVEACGVAGVAASSLTSCTCRSAP